ncbi:hypothetical protein [Methylobacterium radiotolerans]|uniref:Uncharacterized protein n=3 Tax=Alphaproteobacteria TaxID=28211 RepID=B1MA43_METRJ|nr:hypothetical protein [Methylobacterium radiotolerans]ACB28368.1 conserved hypothetical protein [Methylobacterium radiotolerans JCM 2831]
MGIINLTAEEQRALARIDERELDRLIEQALDHEQAIPLYGLPLTSCGPYVSQQYSNFQRDLTAYREAKANRKREETGERARRSGNRLSAAVEQMKHQLTTEAAEGQFFFVDDQLSPLLSFSDRLRFVVHYRWRKAVDDEWNRGSIEFVHTVRPRPVYTMPPKRKPTAAKLREQEQNDRYDAWKSLTDGACQHVRDYLREGKDPAARPASFAVKTDGQGYLNNFSTRFWSAEI